MSPSDKFELEKYAKQTSVDFDKLKVHIQRDMQEAFCTSSSSGNQVGGLLDAFY